MCRLCGFTSLILAFILQSLFFSSHEKEKNQKYNYKNKIYLAKVQISKYYLKKILLYIVNIYIFYTNA